MGASTNRAGAEARLIRYNPQPPGIQPVKERKMAQIFFGFGSSHGPLLSSSPEHWDFRTAADKANPAHPYRGKTYTFDQLLALRKDDNLAALNRIEVRRERHARCQHQLDRL